MRKIQKHLHINAEILNKVAKIINSFTTQIKNLDVTAAQVREMDYDKFYNLVAWLSIQKDSKDFDNEILFPMGETENGEPDGNLETFAAEVQDMIIEILEEKETMSQYSMSESREMAILQAQAGWHKVATRMSLN